MARYQVALAEAPSDVLGVLVASEGSLPFRTIVDQAAPKDVHLDDALVATSRALRLLIDIGMARYCGEDDGHQGSLYEATDEGRQAVRCD